MVGARRPARGVSEAVKKQRIMGNRLYVGNLSFSTTQAAIEHHAVELRDRSASGLGRAHRHEREPAGLPGLAIGRHRHFANLPNRGKSGLDGLLGGAE